MLSSRQPVTQLAKAIDRLVETPGPSESADRMAEVKALIATTKTKMADDDANYRATVGQLARANLFLDQIGAFAHIGTWGMNLATKVITWSDEVLRIRELDMHHDISMAAAIDFYVESDRARVAEHIAAAIERRQPFSFEADIVTARGNHRRVRAYGTIDDSGADGPAMVGIIQDITEFVADA